MHATKRFLSKNKTALWAPALASAMLALALASSGCFVRIDMPSTDPLVDAVSQRVSLESSNGEFDAIYISTHGNETPILTPSNDGNVTVAATFYAERLEDISRFVSSNLKKEQDGRNLLLSLKSTFYQCRLKQLTTTSKSFTQVSGLCVGAIEVSLPLNSKTKVFVNNRRVDHNGPISWSEAFDEMKTHSFGSEKVKVIRAFVESNQTPQRFISMNEAVRMLEALDFDSTKIEAAELFSGRISDPENAGRAYSSFSFDSQRESALGLLAK